MKSIEDIKNAFYINLEHRTDRKEHVENELKKVNINATRFNAIKMTNGAIGCSMSHLKCLQTALENNWDHVLICEDDITFLNPEVFMNQLNTFLSTRKTWDVILLAGNNVPPYAKIDDTCIRVSRCQTTTGYIVNGHYIKTLIENIRKGLTFLLNDPSKHSLYAIDKYWFYLQQKDYWYLIIPLTIIQKPDYSDIEKKNTNYNKLMLDIDKPHLFNPQPIYAYRY